MFSEVFSEPVLSFASPPLLFKLLFKKLPARPTREILAVFAHFTKEKYLEMIKPEKMLNMDYRPYRKLRPCSETVPKTLTALIKHDLFLLKCQWVLIIN